MADSLAVEVGKLNWAVLGVAISIVLIEIGFLLAYRAGGELSTAFVTTAAVVTISTLTIGSLFFRESISVTRLVASLCASQALPSPASKQLDPRYPFHFIRQHHVR